MIGFYFGIWRADRLRRAREHSRHHVFNPVQTMRRARQERLLQMAGSLTFTSLLALVPFLAVSFALFAHFQLFRPLGAVLEANVLTNLLPPELARTVIRYLYRFSANAHQLPWLGSLCLLVTAIAMLLTVENAFNQIWRVKRHRPLVRRVGVYLAALALGPGVLAASLWASTCLLGLSTGWLTPVSGRATFLLSSGPVVLNIVGLACLYRFMPNAPVRWRDAMLGGLIAGLLLEVGKHGFAAYVLKLPTYRTVYGAFAVLPVFLLWMYYSWLATLSAGLIAANAVRGTRSRSTVQR